MVVVKFPGRKRGGEPSAGDSQEPANPSIDKALQAMSDITRASAKIDNAIAVMDEVVAQIALLAANAEAHAGMAGDAKEVLTVVAEVRGLAERSARAAAEIKALAAASPVRMSHADFVAQVAPTIQGLAADAIALTDLMRKAGLADPRP
jgi:methyl-accepting chemotaxis protein